MPAARTPLSIDPEAVASPEIDSPQTMTRKAAAVKAPTAAAPASCGISGNVTAMTALATNTKLFNFSGKACGGDSNTTSSSSYDTYDRSSGTFGNISISGGGSEGGGKPGTIPCNSCFSNTRNSRSTCSNMLFQRVNSKNLSTIAISARLSKAAAANAPAAAAPAIENQQQLWR